MTLIEEKTVIRDRLIQILMLITGYKKDFIYNNIECSLTGNTFQLESYEMVYYLLKISEDYDISFCFEDVENYTFNTIASITDLISRKIGIDARE